MIEMGNSIRGFSYPCQNSIMKHFRMEVRYRLVFRTQSRYLNTTNNTVPFQFDSIQISMQKIIFHDFWYWQMSRGKVEIQGFRKRSSKVKTHQISNKATEELAMLTIFKFFLDRPGTIIKKLNVLNTEALEYCPIVYVSDEVMLWNNDYIPMEYYKRIQPYKSIRKATIHHDGGELEFYKMPVIATAKEWHVHFALPLNIFLDSQVNTITWECREIPYDTISDVYANWKATNRPEGASFHIITSNLILSLALLEMASNLPTAKVSGCGKPILVDSIVNLELNKDHKMKIYIDKKYSIKMEVVKVDRWWKSLCCAIL